MADNEENEQLIWVFDSLVGFLKGPVWNIPIMTFIEQKSIIFEPAEENESEYKKIHEEYKNLVDFMLGSHMEDLGISPEQFEKACGLVSVQCAELLVLLRFPQSLFEQVWAADDYEIFKRLMISKNLELQLQALELLAAKFGLVPESLIGENTFNPLKDEELLMEEVLKRSLEEHTMMKEQEQQEIEELEKALQDSKARLESERIIEHQLMEKAMKSSINNMIGEETAEEQPETTPPTPPPAVSINPDEMKKRQEYLIKQRDRLLALKRQEREKQLNIYENENSTAEKRPRTARAAKSAINMEASSDPHEMDPKTLAFRRSLAARLKAEVVDA